MSSKKSFPLVYLEWCDAISHDKDWMPLNDIKEWGENSDWIIKQTSFVLKETNKYLLVASRINSHEDGETNVNGIIKIPKTWILKRINLTKYIS